MCKLTLILATQRPRSDVWRLRKTGTLCITIALSVVSCLCNDAAAQHRKVTSNADLLLDATLFDTATDDNVELFGFIHVQTQVEPIAGTVRLHANVREDRFFAYAINDQAPPNPLLEQLEILKNRVRELKNQISALAQQILELQRQLEEVKNTDSNPLLPGHQVDKQRLNELQSMLSQRSAELQQRKRELSDTLDEIQSLLEEIQQQQQEQEEDFITPYRAFGADAVGPVPCSLELLCEEVVSFDLIRSSGDASLFEVRLRVQFTELGRFSAGDASLEHESTDSDDEHGGGDVDAPPCP